MTKHLNDFYKIIVDLLNLNVEIDDEDKALLLLNSLPNTYEHLITTLLYRKEEIKFDDVSNTLINNEYWKNDKQVHQDISSEALHIRGRLERSNLGRDMANPALSQEERQPNKD